MLNRKVLVLLAAVPLALVAGCVTRAEVDALRTDVNKAQATAEAAQRGADYAAAEARKATAAANAASEKADRIYRESLRK